MLAQVKTSQDGFSPSRERILQLKKERGSRIFVGLPTLNEEKTIRRVIESYYIKGVVDEIMVLDSGSTDKTLNICREFRVPMIQSNEFLPNLDPNLERGKGANLWLGLLKAKQMSCNVAVFLDTDKQNPSPKELLKLIHPILENPKIVLVKALYKRETHLSGQPIPGGRVTRFTVLPLLRVFFPELNEISQPINGNIALRTDWFLDIPLSLGYGADLEILIQAVMKGGMVSQVNCGTFIQEGQSDEALEAMANEYVRVLLRLAEDYGRIKTRVPFLSPNHLLPVNSFLNNKID